MGVVELERIPAAEVMVKSCEATPTLVPSPPRTTFLRLCGLFGGEGRGEGAKSNLPHRCRLTLSVDPLTLTLSPAIGFEGVGKSLAGERGLGLSTLIAAGVTP